MNSARDSLLLRTNAFALTPESCGTVQAVEVPNQFDALWWQATERWRAQCKRNDVWLPYSSLAVALRVMSGDFVHVQPKHFDEEPVFLVSREPLPLMVLKKALLAWEIGLFGETMGLARAFEETRAEPRLVWDALAVPLREGRKPPDWVWEAAKWEVVDRLRRQPLEIDNVAIRFRVDSEANLLSWDEPCWAIKRSKKGAQKELRQAALSRIDVRVVTVPGHDTPHVLIVPSLSRLTDRLGGWVRSVRVDRGPDRPLLLARIRSMPGPDGWKICWDDRVAEVLDHAELEPLPRLEDGVLSFDGKVRAAPKTARPGAWIGKGPGQPFFEATSVWAHATLPELVPLALHSAKGNLPWNKKGGVAPSQTDIAAAQAALERPIRFVALYHDLETRKRMREGLEAVLALEPQALGDIDDTLYKAPSGIEVVFRAPEDGQVLIAYGDAERTRVEVIGSLRADLDSGRQLAVLVETLSAQTLNGKAKAGKGEDPKPVIRQLLATKGAVTQFLANRPEEPREGQTDTRDSKAVKNGGTDDVLPAEPDGSDDDHPAVRAVWDLLRGVGLFPFAFPGLEDEVEAGAWMVGVFAVKRTRKFRNPFDPGSGYALSLVAIQAEGHRALGFHPERGWLPLAQATAQAHATLKMMTDQGARDCLERALEQLPAAPGERIALFIDAIGCRRFWVGLQDTGAFTFPEIIDRRDMAVVRVRNGRLEVPSGAGFGGWPSRSEPGSFSARQRLLEPPEMCSDGAYYYLSSSRVMERQRAPRKRSRYAASLKPLDLKADWHSWSLRELWSRRPGPFAPRVLARWGAVLCRFAPTWDGVLSRPAPLHLARCILSDHPGHVLEEEPEEDGAEVEG